MCGINKEAKRSENINRYSHVHASMQKAEEGVKLLIVYCTFSFVLFVYYSFLWPCNKNIYDAKAPNM